MLFFFFLTSGKLFSPSVVNHPFREIKVDFLFYALHSAWPRDAVIVLFFKPPCAFDLCRMSFDINILCGIALNFPLSIACSSILKLQNDVTFSYEQISLIRVSNNLF